MELTVDGAPHTVATPNQPFAFPGDATTICRLLSGPIVDFNVMTRRTRATAHVEVAHEGFSLGTRRGELVLVVALMGTVTFDEPSVTLDRLDAAVFSGQDAGAVRVEGAAAIVTLTPASGSPGL